VNKAGGFADTWTVPKSSLAPGSWGRDLGSSASGCGCVSVEELRVPCLQQGCPGLGVCTWEWGEATAVGAQLTSRAGEGLGAQGSDCMK